ncbi:MAG: hypothetical protein EXS38_11420 [Opitutus sp.]|nr:hypothetical protein [Opitutus sp.]
MNLCSVLLTLLLGGFAVLGLRGAPIKHEFVAIDEGLGTLLHVDENNPAKNWIVPAGQQLPRDLQLIGGGWILLGHDTGFSEFELVTGKLRKEVARYKGVTSARRLANGHTLLVGVNLDGSTGVVLLEVDDSSVIKKTVLPGTYVRLARETSAGTFLLMSDTMIREVTRDGAAVHEWTVPDFRHAWKAVRLPDGHTLASAGYNPFLVELDDRGAVVRKIGAKSEALAFAKPNFYAMFQLLPNDDIVVTNWQGHGPGHGASGVQLLQFDRSGAVVWQWSDAKIISSLQGVLVLDGLDPSVLHDERSGVMAPIR